MACGLSSMYISRLIHEKLYIPALDGNEKKSAVDILGIRMLEKNEVVGILRMGTSTCVVAVLPGHVTSGID